MNLGIRVLYPGSVFARRASCRHIWCGKYEERSRQGAVVETSLGGSGLVGVALHHYTAFAVPGRFQVGVHRIRSFQALFVVFESTKLRFFQGLAARASGAVAYSRLDADEASYRGFELDV